MGFLQKTSLTLIHSSLFEGSVAWSLKSAFVAFFVGGASRFTLRLKIAQKPYVVWFLGPKALTYESLEP